MSGIRLALVGYGRHAPQHLAVLRQLGARFVACCNRSEENRSKAQREGQIPNVYGSIAQMLESEKPDGVVCCASVAQIFTAAAEILPFGMPTLIEKPPGISMAEFDELQLLAQKHATPAMVGLNRRFYSVLLRAIEDAGGIDVITQVAVEWSEDPQHMLGRGFSPDDVARMIFGNSLHGLDLLVFLAGKLPTSQITVSNHGDPFRWIMALQAKSERNVVATFNSNWDSPGRWRLQFCSPTRRYVLAPLESCVVLERGIKTERVIEPHERDRQFKPGFYDQAAAFLKMIESRQPPADASLAAARGGMALAESLTNALIVEDLAR